MAVKKMIDNDLGFVHTLEAILGIFLIVGTVLFTTNALPYTAQRTGEHSKVQLVNIGRDALNLIELTPITDIFRYNYSKSQGVRRDYNLTTDRIYARPYEPINFTVYYIDTEDIVYDNLILERTVLGLKSPTATKSIYGTTTWLFPQIGEHNVRAYKGEEKSPDAWSNYVTIHIGYYFLQTDINGIYANADINVDGIVYDINNSGVPNLSVQILDSTGSLADCTVKGKKYIFDNVTMTSNNGNFSFFWPTKIDNGDCLSSGSYYIQARDIDGMSSNRHRIIYNDNKQDSIGILCCDSVINETESVVITLNATKQNADLDPIGQFNINQVFYKDKGGNGNNINASLVDKIDLTFLDPNCGKQGQKNCKDVTFTGYVAGDYYIFYGNTGQGENLQDPAKAAKTNGILIRVLPLQGKCLFAECKFDCASLYIENLASYMRIFLPVNINYNLYLIDPDGSLCDLCDRFEEIANGYPTDEAVTVNKIFHLRDKDGEYLRELRMILWYK